MPSYDIFFFGIIFFMFGVFKFLGVWLLIFNCDRINYMVIANDSITTKNKVFILKVEYLRLKKLEERFKDFWVYLEHLMDIREAREDVKQKKVIPQEKLFKQLGF